VPSVTYGAGTEELAAYALLNNERSNCGFGLLAQNTKLDTAAAGHANYLLRNNYAGHYQDSTKPFFTGVSPGDRATAAGYSWAIILDDNADTTGGTANILTGMGAAGVRSLLSAPYHALSLMSSELDIGLSVMSSDTTGTTGTYGPRNIVQINIGLAQGSYSQKPDGATVQTYPCNGTVGTAYKLTNESPNPITGRDLSVNPVGQPISVAVRPGQLITITGATMVKKSDGSSVPLLPTLTHDNDPNHMIDWSHAVVIPDQPLLPNTDYTVTLTGTNQTMASFTNGAPVSSGTNPAITANSTGAFTQTFTFTTGS
jgi:hypothetical protein